ncbi:hypothetical protein PO909_009959 [Leuciscus waleckii]
MASASSSQSTLRLGRAKKSPTVMDQIGKLFGGEKKKKGKDKNYVAQFVMFHCVIITNKTIDSKHNYAI